MVSNRSPYELLEFLPRPIEKAYESKKKFQIRVFYKTATIMEDCEDKLLDAIIFDFHYDTRLRLTGVVCLPEAGDIEQTMAYTTIIEALQNERISRNDFYRLGNCVLRRKPEAMKKLLAALQIKFDSTSTRNRMFM